MVKTIQSSLPPSPNFDRITVSFDELNNFDDNRSCDRIKGNTNLNFSQTQLIKVCSPCKLIFNIYSPPTFLVILHCYKK